MFVRSYKCMFSSSIRKETIDDILNPYKSKFLKNGVVEVLDDSSYPLLYGGFSIPRSPYLNKEISSGHLNATDSLICLNQLMFCGFAEILESANLIDRLALQSLPNWREYAQRGIIRENSQKFRKEVNPSDFRAEIEIKSIRKIPHGIIIPTIFNFEDGSIEGRTTYYWSLS